MVLAPQCRVCGERHWLYQPHVVTATVYAARTLKTAKRKVLSQKLTTPTAPAQPVTKVPQWINQVVEVSEAIGVLRNGAPTPTSDVPPTGSDTRSAGVGALSEVTGTVHRDTTGTPESVPVKTGRPKVHASAAEKQRAYRARRKGTD